MLILKVLQNNGAGLQSILAAMQSNAMINNKVVGVWVGLAFSHSGASADTRVKH